MFYSLYSLKRLIRTLSNICDKAFCKNSYRFLSASCFVKSSITDIGQGSKIRLCNIKTVSAAVSLVFH